MARPVARDEVSSRQRRDGLKALMGFVTCVLINTSRTKTYVGQTNDVDARLRLHNAGKVRSTRSNGPWVLLHAEAYQTRAEAMAREQWFKSRQGRQKVKQLILERWPSG